MCRLVFAAARYCLLFHALPRFGVVGWSTVRLPTTPARRPCRSSLSAVPAKNDRKAPGGGFGGSSTTAASTKSVDEKSIAIRADKTSLEKQWDAFVAITDLEIVAPPTDDGAPAFSVADVFVRSATTSEKSGTPWFRIGKVCADGATTLEAALALQKGLAFWTAVHMRRELVAAGGKSGAATLDLGYANATMTVGTESDPPIRQEDGVGIRLAEKVLVTDVVPHSFGFRPDWNPPGFTYKRREKAAMKRKNG